MAPPLTTFKALSFDCYGTLIDWETGLTTDLSPITSQLPPTHPLLSTPLSAVQRFDDFQCHLWETQPTLPYNQTLSECFRLLAREVSVPFSESDAVHAGSGPGRWSPFPDTIAALQKLSKRYKLIILSNVNDDNIASTINNSLEGKVKFDAVYTAQKIGSYKPSLNNFQYLFSHTKEDLGVDKEKGELLHVARSLTADHIPAKEVGLRSVFIARGGTDPKNYGTGGNLEELSREGKVGFEWTFETLGDFADEVERQFAELEQGQK
ncbi:Haloacid dehalogenase-like hydrolase-domain-containing protein [Apiosordaria backusii]|uniref:Haloacid dehalogenase-like hydrolase-domain-containing protein n=1 Tax=Apiosordaria backusii TaxID=314023 RepID=A0AA40BE39_9PEZI|nr:Haloacid dehalogenase-like hydrolase-domain-containing protein [Apiosordaria backusii]